MGLTEQQKLDAIKAAAEAAATPATQPVSGPLTDTQLRAAAVPVSGPLTDTQLRAAAVPVSGPLTDTQLRAAAVPVSGPLTDTQLRAAAVPVSGPLTDTQLRAAPVPTPVRPSERAGHTQFQHRRTSAGTFRAITGGTTGYLAWLTVSATNTSTTADLEVLIQDNGTTVWSIFVPRTVVGGAPGAVNLPGVLPEPLRFATNIQLATSGGTLGSLAATLGGYEA